MNSGDVEPASGLGDYRSVNSQGWDILALLDSPAPFDLATARERLDPSSWIPWDQIHSVLCVAGGGGEQAPLFAALGYEVTVVDLSAGQLERDREVPHELGVLSGVSLGGRARPQPSERPSVRSRVSTDFGVLRP